jgi:5-methylthioadenosine/S-adenosylhomocysteine deaminase
MPGLVSAHTHSPMVLFRGLVEGHSLFSLDGWYNTIRVVEEVMQPEMVPAAVTVSCAEMIRTGTTTFADQYFWMDRIVPPVRESGLRAALAYGIVELGDPDARERELAAAETFLESLQDDPLLTAWLGPHAFFVDNRPEAMLRELELVRKPKTGFHSHLGTSGEEDRIWREQFGCTGIEKLERMGSL